jgi:phosphatidylserine/phosphatidylglycerophosphate/cardiolipin synthase-like enzyme
MDIDLSRSLGVVTSKASVVKEALRLFECDSKRRPYKNTEKEFIVSPVNARKQLTDFIAGTKKKLLIYEMKISDPDFLKLLRRKVSEGAEVRVVSRASTKGDIPVRRLPSRLHLRAMLRDGKAAFLGSQSLRKLELEARREIGLVFRDKKVVKRMDEIFEKDWRRSEPVLPESQFASALDVPAKKVAKEVARKVDIKPVLEQVLDKVIDTKDPTPFEPEEVAETVREAFHDEVQGAVQEALKDIVASAVLGPATKQEEKGK